MNLSSAIEDFRHARFRAKLEQVLARLSGQSAQLLEYEEVRQKLRANVQMPGGLQDIPLDAIVGSVGRNADFTRSFWPRQDSDKGRWARVKVAVTDLAGLPPIEVYQIGQAYFVLDGNHRVSVARQLGATHIQAYVTQVQAKVPLSPDVQPDDLILKAEYVDFVEHTQLGRLYPDADLSTSVPGQYQHLKEHISVHRYFMGIDQKKEIPYNEAIAHWYEAIYLPVVQIIREQGMLRDFPGRTEADLYLWIMEHRTALNEAFQLTIRPETAAHDLIDRFSPTPQRIVARMSEAISQAVVPRVIASGPSPGAWREKWEVLRREDRLFSNILVTVIGQESGWHTVEQAIEIVRREDGQLLGLHVVPTEDEKESEAVRAMQAEFARRAEVSRVSAEWAVAAGSTASRIQELSRWISLTVVNLAHPPDDRPIARLSSGFRTLIQSCPTPILAVPQACSSLNRVLLAYDGSPKADEALYVSTYLAGQWGVSLTVVTVVETENVVSKTLTRAQEYLQEHGVEATYVTARGTVGETILRTAREHSSELIVIGGYGFSPLMQIVLSSAVDYVLRESRQPTLICR